MEKLRINAAHPVKIEVNDDGEYITLNLADREFPKRFYDMFNHVNNKYNDLSARKEELEQMDADKQMEVELDTYRSIMYDIDHVFGEGTCKKVFGDIVPDMFAFTEFFEQIIPILKKYGTERGNIIRGKYSASRKGAR